MRHLRSVLVALVALLSLGAPARADDRARVTPGKTAGPLGIEVAYPRQHPLDRPVRVEVTIWSSEAADELSVVLRLPAEVDWGKGPREGVWKGVEPGQRRSVVFTLVPRRPGSALVNVDAAVASRGRVSHRTGAFTLQGGGELAP